MNRGRIKDSADASQDGNQIGIGIAEPPNLEDVVVDVEDANDILGCPHAAKLTELGSSPLEKGEGGLEAARLVLMDRDGWSDRHGRENPIT